MTETKFTKGPWDIGRVPIQSRGGSNTCLKIGPFVACIYDDYRQRERGITEQEIVANADLIAAAPKLYETVEDLLDVISWPGGDGYEVDANRPNVRKAEAVLAKARGENPEVTPWAMK